MRGRAPRIILRYVLVFMLLILVVDAILDRSISDSFLIPSHLILGALTVFFYLVLSRALEQREQAESGREAALEALRHAYDQLESRVLERTAELTRTNQALEAEIAERKRVEEALIIKDNAIESSINAIGIADLQGRLTYVNPAFVALWGYDNVYEVLGKSVLEFWQDPAQAAQVMQTVEKTDRWTGELVARHRQGHSMHLELMASLVRDSAGNPVCRMASFSDITERLRAETALRESEERFRRAVLEAPFPIMIHAEDGQVIAINQVWSELTGYTRDDIPTTADWTQRAYGHRNASIKATIDSLYRLDRRQDEGEFIVTTAQGSTRVWDFSSAPLSKLADGRRVVISMARDITERKQTEETMAWLASFPELNPNPIVEIDLEGHVTYLNASALKLFPDLHSAGFAHPLLAGLDSFVAQLPGGAGSDSHEIILADTSWYLTIFHVPVLERIRIYAVNITRRKQAEQALQQAYDELEQRVYERTVLEERQRLARELHDSVSQSLYSISLGAHTALALQDRDRDKVTEALRYILSMADAGLTEMRALIFELRPESLAAEGLAAALRKQAAALRVRHEIEIETELCDEPDLALTAKEAVYRIAQEALHNAIKHARATRLGLQLASGPDCLVLEVKDDGVGFDPAGAFAGHLGLRSMRERAARIEGILTIISAAGQGTRVRLELPRQP